MEDGMPLQTFRELPAEELERMERLAEAATIGPWLSCVAGRDTDVEASYIELGVCNELGSCRSIELIGGTIADQDFIASARQDLPLLILEVRRLRARLSTRRDSDENLEQQTLSGKNAGTSGLLSACT
jgi:hypothetical protein